MPKDKQKVKQLKKQIQDAIDAGTLTQEQFSNLSQQIVDAGGDVQQNLQSNVESFFSSQNNTGNTNLSDLGGIAGSVANAPTTSTPSEDINKLVDAISVGESLGKGIIADQGLGGEFLGSVSEQIGPEQQAALEFFQNLASNSGQVTALEQEALDQARAALGGLSAEENLALRENAEKGIDTGFQSALRSLSSLQGQRGRIGVSGAQQRDLITGLLGAQNQLERDIIVQDLAQQNLAREAFTNLASGTSQNIFGRQLAAGQGLATNAQLADQFRLNAALSNIGLRGQEISTRLGTTLGALGTAAGTLGGFRAEDFAKKAFEESLAAKKESEDKQLALTNKILESQDNIFSQFGGQFGL